jgi:hypothetical protein
VDRTSAGAMPPSGPIARGDEVHLAPPGGDEAKTLSESDAPAYLSEIANPLKSALAINPTWRPDSLSPAPFSFCNTMVRPPTPNAAPAPTPT